MKMETAKRIQTIYGWARVITLLLFIYLCWLGISK